MKVGALAPKQQRFVIEYLIDLNATQAARRAGYSERTANEQGSRLLANVSVQQAIARAVAARIRRTEIAQDRVVQELARIAFSDMKNYVTWGPDGVHLQPSAELGETESTAVREVSETITEHSSTVRFKLHDKKGALDSLAKHLGMFVDRDLPEDKPVQIKRVTIVLPAGYERPGYEPGTVEGDVARVE